MGNYTMSLRHKDQMEIGNYFIEKEKTKNVEHYFRNQMNFKQQNRQPRRLSYMICDPYLSYYFSR